MLSLSIIIPAKAQKSPNWYLSKVKASLGYESQIAINEDVNLTNVPIVIGYKINPNFDIGFCVESSLLLYNSEKRFQNMSNTGLACSYRCFHKEEPKPENILLEIETRFQYGQSFNNDSLDNFNYNINVKMIPAYFPYCYMGAGIHHYLFNDFKSDLFCLFISFGLRY